MDSVKIALKNLIDAVDETVGIPAPNCSCHLSPPCRDCFEWGGLREAMAEARAATVKPPAPPADPPPPPCPRCRALTRLVCGSPECGNRPAELPPIPINQVDEE